MEQSGAVVVADDVTLEYPAGHGSARFVAVSGVTFSVARGELFGVVGETGSGKSTLVAALAGLAGLAQHGSPEITGGSLRVLGHELRGIRPRERNRLTFAVGYLPQDAGRTLVPGYTVAENIAQPLFSRDKGYDRKAAGVRVATLLDAVQLPLGAMTLFPHELSSGQRQRVAIARSLILDPDLWVADEPTAGVDVLVRGPVLDSIFELQSAREFSAVIVSHDLAISARSTDRIAVLQRGALVGLGRFEDVLSAPQHPYVAGLAEDYELRTGPITLPVLDRSARTEPRAGS